MRCPPQYSAPHFLRQGYSLNLELNDWLPWLSSKSQGSCVPLPSVEVTGVCCCTPLSVFLRIRTQVLRLPTGSSPQPCLSFAPECAPGECCLCLCLSKTDSHRSIHALLCYWGLRKQRPREVFMSTYKLQKQESDTHGASALCKVLAYTLSYPVLHRATSVPRA